MKQRSNIASWISCSSNLVKTRAASRSHWNGAVNLQRLSIRVPVGLDIFMGCGYLPGSSLPTGLLVLPNVEPARRSRAESTALMSSLLSSMVPCSSIG